LASQVVNRPTGKLRDLVANSAVIRAAECEPLAVPELFRDCASHHREIFERPAFRRAVFSAGI
jgi:hypothetical protein